MTTKTGFYAETHCIGRSGTLPSNYPSCILEPPSSTKNFGSFALASSAEKFHNCNPVLKWPLSVDAINRPPDGVGGSVVALSRDLLMVEHIVDLPWAVVAFRTGTGLTTVETGVENARFQGLPAECRARVGRRSGPHGRSRALGTHRPGPLNRRRRRRCRRGAQRGQGTPSSSL